VRFAPVFSGPAADSLRASGARVAITGASGWIGKATLELLWNSLGEDAFRRRVLAFGSAPRVVGFGEGRTIAQQALSDLLDLEHAPTLVLHLAFLTKDKVAGMDDETYVSSNRALSELVLSALDPIGATGVFVASSGAALRAAHPAASRAMRLYGSLKKADEDAFGGWAEANARRAVIGRIFSLSGPHINKHENYALASFIKDALAGGPIAIRANFPVYRSYVAIRELMSLVFATLLESTPGVLRFSSGGDRYEMQDIAEIIGTILGPVPIQRPPLTGECCDDYTGSDVAYRQLLASYSIEEIPFAQQVLETAAFFASDSETAALEGSSYWRAGGASDAAEKGMTS